MALGRLSSLQERVLVVLAGLDPPWTLSGGAALAGFHTRHRETRDLDLFWQSRRELGNVALDARRRMEQAGLEVAVVQTAAAFCRFVAFATDFPDSATFLVDTPHQILVNKLCALLSRSEVRDLVDVKALLEAGGDLRRALMDCPQQDGGFSPLTLAWSMRGLPIRRLAAALGFAPEMVDELERFRDELVDRILAEARPKQ